VNREKILIFGPSWVGDMMMAKSLFSNLKKRNPKCIIHLAAPRWSIDIANRFSEIDKTIPLDFSHGKLDLIKRVRLSLSLRKEKYDECIFLVNTFKSLFSILFANIKLRTGYIGERRGLFLNNAFQNNVLPTIEKFTALSRSKSYKPKIISPSIEFDKTRGIKFLSKRKIPHHKLVVIAGGAEYGPAKILPQQKYAHIAIKLIEKGFHILLVGSKNDEKINHHINELTNFQCFDITGKTSLKDCIDIFSLSKYFLSNDSGLMHIAAALKLKQESFFGSSDPKHTPPVNKNSFINYLNLECSPCFKRECPLNHFNCMNQINESEVANRIICAIKK